MPAVVVFALYADKVPGADDIGDAGRRAPHGVFGEIGVGLAQAVIPEQLVRGAITEQQVNAVLAQAGDNCRRQARYHRRVCQRGKPRGRGPAICLSCVCRGRQLTLRSAVAVASVVGHESVDHGLLGELLQFAVDGGVDVITVGVGRHAVAFEHFLACHFGGVVRGEAQLRAVVLGAGRLPHGGGPVLLLDIAQRQHTSQNPVAALLAGLGAADRVVARGCLGNTGQHGVLRQGQLADAGAVVHLRRGLETVGAVAEEYTVEVQLENFFLLQRALDFDGQENLIELAGKGALQAEKVVACHLHGQGAAAGAFLSGQCQLRHRTHQPGEVNAAVSEEAVVFGGQQGLHELGRNILKTQWIPLLLAKLSNQVAISRIDLHRSLQADVAQGLHIGQAGVEV